MRNETINMKIFGAKTVCTSCVNGPSSMETKEWLEAALKRKYPDIPFHFHYIDIEETSGEISEDQEMANRILEEEFFYPLVLLEDEVVAEGNPRLKEIYKKIDEKVGHSS